MVPDDIAKLRDEVDALGKAIASEGAVIAAGWRDSIERPDFQDSAVNLAEYLALRRRDLRPLQRRLMALGLSSIGRLESRVGPTFAALLAALDAITGATPRRPFPDEADFFAGEQRLAART